MIRLAPLITADVDTTTLSGGKASDAAQDFLALLSEALTGEATTDKATPQLLVATDKPTTKGEPLVSDIVSDAQQADLLIPVDETPPVINDEQSTSTPLNTAQTITLAAAADNNTAKGGKKQYHDKAEINDMTRPQAACEFFQPALVFHFCLVLHPDDSQPAFL